MQVQEEHYQYPLDGWLAIPGLEFKGEDPQDCREMADQTISIHPKGGNTIRRTLA